MPKFLLDANISPETAEVFRKLGYNTKSIQEDALGKLSDEEVIKLARQEKRIIVTFDHDFAYAWYFVERGKVGVIFLRTRFQTTEYVERIISHFLQAKTIEKERLEKALVVLSEVGHRIVRV